MSQIRNFEELNKMLENSEVISLDATDMLLDLDVLPSTTSQAALNHMLVDFGKRLKSGANVIVEAINKDENTTFEMYQKWLHDEFTTYSYNMFMKTV